MTNTADIRANDLPQLLEILDRLDSEENEQVRADLIDWAITLADRTPACAKEWAAYR